MKLTVHLANGSKFTQWKSSDHVQNWQMDLFHKRKSKVQDHCSKVHKNEAQLLKDQFEESPVCSLSDFSMDQEDSNNAMENLRDRSCHPRPHWAKDHCSIFTRQLIQLLFSQVITSHAPKPRFHPWGSSIFLLFKFILFAHLNS